MNIFRILSSNDGSINEPNVSSFLAYLLDPNEDHGISSLLLQAILNDIIAIDKAYLSKIQFQDRVCDLSKYSGYTINIIPELTVHLERKGKRKRRDIDIIIEIKDDKTDVILYSICLENKITDNSIIKGDSQLEDELKGLRNYYAESNNEPDIFIVYLTPSPSNISNESFAKLEYEKKLHLYWDSHENSIFNKLITIFDDAGKGLIDPINNQSYYLIKSFLSFIKTNFKSYVEERSEKLEKKSYGKPVIDLLKEFASTLDSTIEHSVDSIRHKFSKYVFDLTGIELHSTTRNIHIRLATVNEKNRTHYNIKSIDNPRKNIFYYSDDSKKRLRLFNPNNNLNIPIYFKSNDEVISMTLEEYKLI